MPKVWHECKCKFVNISCQIPLEIYMQHSPGGLVVEPSEAVSTLDDLRGGLFRRRCEQPLPLYGPNIPMHYKNVHATKQ